MRYYVMLCLTMISALAFSFELDLSSSAENRLAVSLARSVAVPDLTADKAFPLVESHTFALPCLQAGINVTGMRWKEFDSGGAYLRTSEQVDPALVYLANSFTFREMHGFTVQVVRQVSHDTSYKVLESVQFDLVGSGTVDLPASVSPSFVRAYKELAANYETSYLRDLPLARPGLLIISHNSLTDYLANFIAWKRSIGYDVYVESIQNIGTTTAALKDFVQNHYSQYHCDHLLILGDVTGSYAVPTNIYTSPDGSEHDADDNHYTMLTGDDYFPEMLSGRFSFGDISELLTMLNKTVSYEKTPYMTNTNWMRRSLVVAGNYAEGGLRPVTPYQMSMWLREKMLATGYTQVDTVFYTLENPTVSGASLIQASINQGVQYVSYRGWGAADGWHYPSFHNVDLNSSLINGSRMPVVFSIVCNTGDYANSLNPCFGEKWMRMGTIASPGGCVGFVGPSDLHTKTNLNNTISSGIFSSILDDGERSLGASVLAGKVELYNNYPLDLASNGNVSFYFHVYNILSDPTLRMWMLVPQTIPTSVINGGTEFAQSASHIRITAPNLNGAIVSGTKDNQSYTYARVHDGYALLPIDPEQVGNLTLTINKPDFVPLVTTLTPTANATVGLVSNSLVGEVLDPGQTYQLALTLKNYSSIPYTNTPVYLSADPGGLVTISNPTQEVTLPQGMSALLNFSFTVSPSTPYGNIVVFQLGIPFAGAGMEFELQTGGPLFTITPEYLGGLTIGSATMVTFNITNTGTAAMQNAAVQVQSSTDAASVISDTINLGDLPVNGFTQFQAAIQVQSGCFVGRSIPLLFTVTGAGGYVTHSHYAMVAGNPSATDPTGPDGYGYFAYDSFDLDYPQHPSYQWVEIDPRNGGAGEVHLIKDDASYTVDLPFSFRYYGIDYDRLTICSNGWVSFVPTWMSDFNNLYIPAALGPYAMVAPYWDDLKGMRVQVDTLYTFNDMRICNWHDQANNRYIVEWNDAYSQYTIELANPSLEKFQLLLYPQTGTDGDIVFQYHTIDNPSLTSNYSTVGVENHLQNDGLTYSFANIYPVTASPLQAGLAVRITTDPPDDFVANEDQAAAQEPFTLGRNQPNPFARETSIGFTVNTKEEVSLNIYNSKGQLVRALHRGRLNKGTHAVTWDGKDDNGAASAVGIYLCKLNAAGQTRTRKLLLVR